MVQSQINVGGNTAMNHLDEYYSRIKSIMDGLSNNTETYQRAGRLISEAVRHKKLIHIVGTEMHSALAAEDIFFRTGSLLNINPLFDPSFSVTHAASRSLYLKEADFCGKFLVEYYRNIHKGDLMIIVDTDGIGRACREVVQKSKELGLDIIVITSREFSENVSNECLYRNDDKINLCDMKEVNLVIDSKVPAFDTVLRVEALKVNAGWVSTITNSFILNAIMLAALEIIEEENISADIWDNFYEPSGLRNNEALIDKYIEKIKHL
jgi:uncharacterized phosphosugar-binding protein